MREQRTENSARLDSSTSFVTCRDQQVRLIGIRPGKTDKTKKEEEKEEEELEEEGEDHE